MVDTKFDRIIPDFRDNTVRPLSTKDYRYALLKPILARICLWVCLGMHPYLLLSISLYPLPWRWP